MRAGRASVLTYVINNRLRHIKPFAAEITNDGAVEARSSVWIDTGVALTGLRQRDEVEVSCVGLELRGR